MRRYAHKNRRGVKRISHAPIEQKPCSLHHLEARLLGINRSISLAFLPPRPWCAEIPGYGAVVCRTSSCRPGQVLSECC